MGLLILQRLRTLRYKLSLDIHSRTVLNRRSRRQDNQRILLQMITISLTTTMAMIATKLTFQATLSFFMFTSAFMRNRSTIEYVENQTLVGILTFTTWNSFQWFIWAFSGRPYDSRLTILLRTGSSRQFLPRYSCHVIQDHPGAGHTHNIDSHECGTALSPLLP